MSGPATLDMSLVYALNIYSGECVKRDSFRVLNACVTRPSCVCMKRVMKRVAISRVYHVFQIANQIDSEETHMNRIFFATARPVNVPR